MQRAAAAQDERRRVAAVQVQGRAEEVGCADDAAAVEGEGTVRQVEGAADVEGPVDLLEGAAGGAQVGRASCRERV